MYLAVRTFPRRHHADAGLDNNGTSVSSGSDERFYWMYMLEPYTGSFAIFKDPSNTKAFTSDTAAGQQAVPSTAIGATGNDYGGQNSYGHKRRLHGSRCSVLDRIRADFGSGQGASRPRLVRRRYRPDSTVIVADSTYYGVAPDINCESGLCTGNATNANAQDIYAVNCDVPNVNNTATTALTVPLTAINTTTTGPTSQRLLELQRQPVRRLAEQHIRSHGCRRLRRHRCAC